MKKSIFAVVLLLSLSAAMVSCSGGHKYVDLGLPSGTLWATCNIGAKTPEDFGGYFAWGETKPKKEYTIENYKFYSNAVLDEYDRINWEEAKITKYGNDEDFGETDNKIILDPIDDAAHKRWGGKWHIPTTEEWGELSEFCEWSWKNINKRRGGYVVTGPNGNSIFLPAAGYEPFGYEEIGVSGYYWSSILDSYESSCAVEFSSDDVDLSERELYLGLSIRPVCRP